MQEEIWGDRIDLGDRVDGAGTAGTAGTAGEMALRAEALQPLPAEAGTPTGGGL